MPSHRGIREYNRWLELTTKLTDKYIVKRNKIRNQITLLRGQTEEGVTMYETVTKLLEEIDHWKDNLSTEDTLDSLTSVETLIIKIHEMNHAIIKE